MVGGDLELQLKEIIMVLVFFGSIGGAYLKINKKVEKSDNRTTSTESDIKKLSEFFKKVVLDDNGEIRLVNKESCKKQKIELQASIDDRADDIKEIRAEVRGMSDNVLLILYHLKIDKTKIIDMKRKNNDRT